MNYYVDLEANCDGTEIIAIGCVKETGEKFYSLVRPQILWKVTSVITRITHIDKASLQKAPRLNEVMKQFLYYIGSIENAKFIFYGDADKNFLIKNFEIAQNHFEKSGLLLMIDNFKDYSPFVKNYYKLPTAIKLIKVYNHLNNSEDVQEHNALEDASMLKFVADNIEKDKYEENPFGDYLNKQQDESKSVILIDCTTGTEYHFDSIRETARWFAKSNDARVLKNMRSYIKRALERGGVYKNYKIQVLDHKNSQKN